VLTDEHRCTSSAMRKTTTPTSSWVASLALPILKCKPHMVAKELQTTLQDKHSCTISYETVWKGKEKALHHLYGCLEDNFQLLFRWKKDVLEKMSNSVIEIELHVEEGKLYFRRFFCTFGPCRQGFHEGCRSYLSIDSTMLNGRWNGHLSSAINMGGHNWMYHVAFRCFEGETKGSRKQLHKAIGEPPLLAIHCDACKGLTGAVKEVFTEAERQECFRHLCRTT
jgi:hypothetical protein